MKASTFCSDKRFREYIELSKRTGKLVGPGTYNDNLARLNFFKRPCPTNYKNPSRINPENSYNYIMVGNQTLYEPGFKNKKLKKSYLYSSNLSVDIKSFVEGQKINELAKIRDLGNFDNLGNSGNLGNVGNSGNLESENFAKSLNNTYTRYSSVGIYGCSSSEKKALEYNNLSPERNKYKYNELLRKGNSLLSNNQNNMENKNLNLKESGPEGLPDLIKLSIKRGKEEKILKGIYSSNKNRKTYFKN